MFDAEEYISKYETAYIIGTKITLDQNVIDNNKGLELSTKIAYDILEKVRFELDARLLDLEKQYGPSRVFFGGVCHICKPEECTRIKGEPCIAPERVRPSLEAFGFDMGKTSAELLRIEMKWSINGILPEYFILVSGLFTESTLLNEMIINTALK